MHWQLLRGFQVRSDTGGGGVKGGRGEDAFKNNSHRPNSENINYNQC